MDDKFEIIGTSSKKAYRFNISADLLKIGDKEMEYSYINIAEGVCVMPIYKGKILCIQQYRFPVRSWEFEFPGGFIDEGETGAEAAARELKEETGLVADELVDLGCMFPSFGSTNEKIHMFAAVCSGMGDSDREDFELIRLNEFSVREFKRLIGEGRFRHGAGLAAWARYGVIRGI